jgi:hypothetical protein
VNEPFAVINADDFYGSDGFVKAAAFLKNECNEKTYSIIGYTLKNTLSEHGTVSRGVCGTDANNNLVEINERTKIYRNEAGSVVYEEDGQLIEVKDSTSVSMNFWCFHPSVFDIIKNLFAAFPKNNFDNIKAEFFIPIIGDYFIKHEGGVIKVIPTSAQWFGVTYKEDAPSVKASLDKLISKRQYPVSLWG